MNGFQFGAWAVMDGWLSQVPDLDLVSLYGSTNVYKTFMPEMF